MREPYEDARKKLCSAILDSSGDSRADLRREIATYAKQLGVDAADSTSAIPPELLAYVTKVARHAYKVTDEDISTLKASGYSEDALFEITLSAALGAGMLRLDSGLEALKGAVYATEKH
jgi:alkylhydroperoxidase family enzyme